MKFLSKLLTRRRAVPLLLCLLALASTASYFLAPTRVPRSAIVSLVRNREIYEVVDMIRNVEDRYNSKFHHDWVFLSEEEFSPSFVETASAFTSGRAIFRTINRKLHWSMPRSIDRDRLSADLKRLSELGVPYGGSNSYRTMCRFQAGIFVEYLAEYRYYMRVDPDVKLYCDMDYDIFDFMWKHNKKYGFTISLKEVPYAVENLWETVEGYVENRTESVLHPNNCLRDFVDGPNGFCHFWSNFEVADLNVFRSQQFQDFFDYLDSTGGFFYNRWGDAPVHSLAMSMFVDRHELHHFGDIGMFHGSNMNCPLTKEERLQRRCTCPHDKQLQKHNQNIFTFKDQSCTPKFLAMNGLTLPDGWIAAADRVVRLEYGTVDPRA